MEKLETEEPMVVMVPQDPTELQEPVETVESKDNKELEETTVSVSYTHLTLPTKA